MVKNNTSFVVLRILGANFPLSFIINVHLHLSFTSFHSYSVVNEIFLEAIKQFKSAISLGIQLPL